MEEFAREVAAMSTADIMLILKDQQDLYTEDELNVLRQALQARPHDRRTLEKEAEAKWQATLDEEVAEERRQASEALLLQAQAAKKLKEQKIAALKEKGAEGYWEYHVMDVTDAGSASPASLAQVLNGMALEGWRVKCAYANEIGKDISTSGVGGITTGTNVTRTQHILILERWIKL